MDTATGYLIFSRHHTSPSPLAYSCYCSDRRVESQNTQSASQAHSNNAIFGKDAINCMFETCWMRPNQATDYVSRFENDERGKTLYAQATRCQWMFVNVHCGEFQPSRIFFTQFMIHWSKGTAWRTPDSREI